MDSEQEKSAVFKELSSSTAVYIIRNHNPCGDSRSFSSLGPIPGYSEKGP
jgi:hypothetical protein